MHNAETWPYLIHTEIAKNTNSSTHQTILQLKTPLTKDVIGFTYSVYQDS